MILVVGHYLQDVVCALHLWHFDLLKSHGCLGEAREKVRVALTLRPMGDPQNRCF